MRFVYGLHPVEEALKAGRVQMLLVADRESMPVGVLMRARDADIAVCAKQRRTLDKLVGHSRHQGMVAVVGDYPYAELEELLAKSDRAALLLVLDGVQDPQNLGALIRSAHLLGASGVVLPKDRSAQVTTAVVKASAGATEHTRVAQVTNLARALEQLKQAGLWMVGAVAKGGQPPWRLDWRGPTALVLGAEGKGLRPLTVRGCDFLVEVPTAGEIDSLNVAAAGAILLYEASRQRLTADDPGR